MNQITEHLLFVTSCYITYLTDIDNAQISDNALQHEISSSSEHRSNKGGFQSQPFRNNNFDNEETFKLFQKFICPMAQQIFNSWNLDKSIDNYAYWYNVNRRYNYNNAHIHPGSYLSGVYYSQVPSDSGRIVFDRSQTELDRLEFQQDHIELNNLKIDNNRVNTQHWFIPEEGMLILFPGHLSHYVEQNLTQDKDDARISLSFNFL